jgi:soluble lytic murein transglycosylase-like protein
MVRAVPLLAAALLVHSAAPSACAQSTDHPSANAHAINWRNAGGDLFVGASQPDPSHASARNEAPGFDANAARLSSPDQPYDVAITEAADRHGLDRKLLHAVVIVESAYRARACSPAGACGLTQLMPGTAADLGVVDRFDISQNLHGGADYLARQILRFGDLRLALAAYNAGPDRVARLGRIPNITETRLYVAAVIDCYLALTAGRGVRSSRECRPAETLL